MNYFDDSIEGKKLFSSSKLIGRFAKYELFEQEPKLPDNNSAWIHKPPPKLFIVPAKNAVYQESSFTAFDFYPNILLDFISLAKNIEGSDKKTAGRYILNFCNIYGLFNISGLYSVTFGKSSIVDFDGIDYSCFPYEYVLLSNSGMRAFEEYHRDSPSMMHIKEFADNFFPESWSGYNRIINDSDNLHIELMNNCYCESVDFLIHEIQDLYWRFEQWFNFDSDKNHSDIEEITGVLMTEPIMVSVSYERNWKLKWIYKSLIEAINIMFLNNIVESKENIRICSNCDTPFIASKKNQKYCNEHCNNAARQKRWYEKHKKKKQDN